jgi:hypothetical protein
VSLRETKDQELARLRDENEDLRHTLEAMRLDAVESLRTERALIVAYLRADEAALSISDELDMPIRSVCAVMRSARDRIERGDHMPKDAFKNWKLTKSNGEAK